MLTNAPPLAIAFEQDEPSTGTDEIYKGLGRVSDVLVPDPPFEYIHSCHREFAYDTARDFNQSQVERIEDELRQGRQVLEAEARLTHRKEFRLWLQSLNATAAEIRKRVKLVQFFGDFPLSKIVAIASAVNIYALCASKFAALVEKFRELPVLATDIIRQMVKEARPPRKPKQQREAPINAPSTVELKQDTVGGGRHLEFQLYDDELIAKINHSVEKEQITRQQAVSIAFKRSDKLEQVQQEHREAIAEVREFQIEMQRQLIEKDERIKDLESALATASLAKVTPCVTDSSAKPAIYIEHFDTWEELAEAINSESDRFVAVVKLASAQERSQFVQLLSAFCERESDALDRLDWVPPKFLDSALRYLSFSVFRFADTSLAEEPVMETIYGCKLLGFKEFGTPSERWGFELPDGKNIAIFERSHFAIERF